MFCSLVSCSGGGGGSDDGYIPPVNPTNPEQPSTPQNNGQVKETCTVCHGNGNCPTCNGIGTGCKACKGTGKCDSCNGSGECKKCYGSGRCDHCDYGYTSCGTCRGSGTCTSCYGTGRYGNIQCPNCKGTKKCRWGSGTGKVKCYYCLGNGKCDRCKGRGNCDVCNGKMICKVCGGDGHCTTCNNSDGKCTNCKGEGYLYYDYILSPSSLEFSKNGGDITVSITTYKKWTVSCYASWLKVNNPEGNGNGSFTVNATPNYDNSSRTATLYLTYEGKSVSIPVTQNAADNSQDELYSNMIKKLLKTPLMLEGIDISKTMYNSLYSALTGKYTFDSGCYGDSDYYGWISVTTEKNPGLTINYRNMNFSYMWLSESTNGTNSRTGFYYEFHINVLELSDPLVMARIIEKDFNNANIPI